MDLRALYLEQALGHLNPPDDFRVKVPFEVTDWVINAEKPLAVTALAEGGQVEVIDGANRTRGVAISIHSHNYSPAV